MHALRFAILAVAAAAAMSLTACHATARESASASTVSQVSSSGDIASVAKTETFDPPIALRPDEFIDSIRIFTGFDGAPSLIMRVPCIRLVIHVKPPPGSPPLAKPGCEWEAQKIFRGDQAGLWLTQNAEMIAFPGDVPDPEPSLVPAPRPSAAVTANLQGEIAGSAVKLIREETFDPPIFLGYYSWLDSIRTFTAFEGAPSLLLGVPCLHLDKRANPRRDRELLPTLTNGCVWQKIPSGKWAGRYLTPGGEIARALPH